MWTTMEIKWGKLRKLPINLFQTRNSHSINEQAFRHTLPLHHLARYPAYFRLCYCFCSTHSLIIPVLLWLAGMKCLHSPKLSQLCLSSLHFLPQGPHSVPWYHHIYVIAASSSLFSSHPTFSWCLYFSASKNKLTILTWNLFQSSYHWY